MRKSFSFCVALLVILLTLPCLAATSKATRVVNDEYHFAFTVEPSCEISYQAGGVGLSAKHIPKDADASTEADYGLLVYGSPRIRLTPAEAEAAGFKRSELILAAADVKDQTELQRIFGAMMQLKQHDKSGEAQVLQTDGKTTLAVPFYQWSQKVGDRTGYALMYVLRHGEGFVYLQVEAKKPFSDRQVQWFTGKLELLTLPSPPPAPPADKPAQPKPKASKPGKS